MVPLLVQRIEFLPHSIGTIILQMNRQRFPLAGQFCRTIGDFFFLVRNFSHTYPLMPPAIIPSLN